jgi:hypothetical protein
MRGARQPHAGGGAVRVGVSAIRNGGFASL